MNRYAIVDLETTGNHAAHHGITEIAVVLHENGKVADTFESLINPEGPINPFVSRMTGITDEMVRHAPRFFEVAKQVWNLTENAVFVAHSVNFDYAFLHAAYKSLGADFRRKKLCTIRLSRKIFPGHSSYGLGNICAALGIPIHDRHRAMGDAQATVKLFEMCLAHDRHNVISMSLKRDSREAILPPELPKEVFDNLPSRTGVYYFHNKKGRVIYVGKAVNIKSRVYSHFTGNDKSVMIGAITNITYEVCGTELIALLLESDEIKRLYPLYNRAQKRDRGQYVLTDYTDRKGVHHLLLMRNHLALQPVAAFNSFDAAREFMFALIERHKLCPRYCGMQSTNGPCFDFQIKKCKGVCAGKEPLHRYNKRVQKAIDEMAADARSRLIIGKGRDPYERSVVVIENGTYKGFGYFNAGQPIETMEQALEVIRPFRHTADVHRILHASA